MSWLPPQQPNGIITSYVVNYRTHDPIDEFHKEVQEKASLNYFIAKNLEENCTYFFSIRAENSAGLGLETVMNVTTGYNKGILQKILIG